MSKILIIEDDITTSLILKADLELEGYQVLVADNGKSGLFKAQEFQPAVIISDWVMPILDGIEVCRQIKTDQNLAITSFILLTSRNSVEALVEALDAGVDEFLSKPIEPEILHLKVRSAIKQYELNRLNFLNKEIQYSKPENF